jgi:hypothetical protein
MQNCHDLVQELVKHAKNHHQHGCPQPTSHPHVVSEEVVNNIDNFEDISVVDVFDIVLTFLDLEKTNTTWFVDFGASERVMGNKNVFSNLEAQSILGVVSTIGCHQLGIEGKGYVTLSKIDEIKFNDVHYVLGLTMNLILIGSLADQDFVIVFHNEKCLVFARLNHVVVRGV